MTTHKAIVVKVPQDVTVDEWALAAAYAYSYRHTVTASHDDMLTVLRGGNAESYVKLLWPRRQPDVPGMIQAAGYVWEAVPGFHAPRIRLGHPFAYRYARSSGFNAPRAYGPHEGIDWVVLGAGADKPVSVLATLSGIVDKVGWAPSGYGNYVRVVSKADGYDVVLWYGHMDKIYVKPGARVVTGEALGEVGNTGNSTGEHLHLTVQLPGYGLDGYVVDDVVDPEPFVPTAAEVGTLPLYDAAGLMVNLLPYLCGDGRAYRVANARGTFEIFQSQREGDRFYQVKAWDDLSVVNYEEFILEGDNILRDVDTSPGAGRYYRLIRPDGRFGVPWVKRQMRIGETVTTQKRVQFYFMNDCKPSADNSGNVKDTIRLVAHHRRLRLKTGIEVEDVIQLRWEDGGEDYWYARGYGLVQWARVHQDPNSPAWSAMSEMRPDVGKLARLRLGCL